MLSITKSKLAGILDQPSDIPTDTTFHVYDEEEKVNIFQAHKYYMALVSEVLRARFFGSLKENSDILVVRGTTAQAFEVLIKYVYHKNCGLENKTVKELFEVANLAEMYDVSDLMTEVGVAIARVPVTLRNAVELAHTAEQFSILSSASRCLMSSCITFLVSTLSHHVLDFSGLIFSSQHQDTAERLHKKILEIPLTGFKRDLKVMLKSHGEGDLSSSSDDTDSEMSDDDENVVCELCDQYVVTRTGLANHMMLIHGEEGDELF